MSAFCQMMTEEVVVQEQVVQMLVLLVRGEREAEVDQEK